MGTFKAKVKAGGKPPPIEVTIEAKNQNDAKRLLEAQYGKGNISASPRPLSRPF